MSSRFMRNAALVGFAGLLTVTIAAAQQRVNNAPGGTGTEGCGITVFNPVDGRIRVLSRRPDGTRVEKGEVVCELDPAGLRDQLASQEIAVQGLRAGLQGARIAREVAVTDLNDAKGWRQTQERTAAQAAVRLAESDMIRREDRLEWATRMFQKGYVSKAELVTEQLAFQHAKLAVEQAQLERQVRAPNVRERTTHELMGAIETARERELSKQAELLRAESTLKRLHDQIDGCKVAAPVAGRIRYDVPIGTGAVVQDGQVLFQIIADGMPTDAVK